MPIDYLFFFLSEKETRVRKFGEGWEEGGRGCLNRSIRIVRDIESATKFSFRSNLKTLIFESVYAIPIFRQNRFIDPYKRINSCNKAKNSKNQTVLFFLPPSISAETIDRFSFLLFFFFYTPLYLNLHGCIQRDAEDCVCVCVYVCVWIPRND